MAVADSSWVSFRHHLSCSLRNLLLPFSHCPQDAGSPDPDCVPLEVNEAAQAAVGGSRAPCCSALWEQMLTVLAASQASSSLWPHTWMQREAPDLSNPNT